MLYLVSFDSEEGRETWLITGKANTIRARLKEITAHAMTCENMRIEMVQTSVSHVRLLAVEPCNKQDTRRGVSRLQVSGL